MCSAGASSGRLDLVSFGFGRYGLGSGHGCGTFTANDALNSASFCCCWLLFYSVHSRFALPTTDPILIAVYVCIDKMTEQRNDDHSGTDVWVWTARDEYLHAENELQCGSTMGSIQINCSKALHSLASWLFTPFTVWPFRRIRYRWTAIGESIKLWLSKLLLLSKCRLICSLSTRCVTYISFIIVINNENMR